LNWSHLFLISFFVSHAGAAEIPAVTPSPSPSVNIVAETLNKLRDPFKRPVLKASLGIRKGDLESFSVESLKVVGVLTGPSQIRALIMSPDGKSHLVTERVKIGIRGGIIKKITPDGILVREKIVNVIGQEENIDTEIQLTAPGSRVLQGDSQGSGNLQNVTIQAPQNDHAAKTGGPVQMSTPLPGGLTPDAAKGAGAPSVGLEWLDKQGG
jgi:hypothetical protein